MDELSPILLTHYSKRFYGYGSGRAKLWFVGMEEAGGKTIEDVASRLRTWESRRPKNGLLDLKAFHIARGETRWHNNQRQLQPTWKQLIRMHRLAYGQGDSLDEMVDFQQSSFGSINGETCVIELLPLPSPSLKVWHYSAWSKIPWLASREEYTAHLLQRRITDIQKAIKKYQPAVVVCYGSTWLPRWRLLSRSNFGQAINGQLMSSVQDGVTYYVVRHPVRESDAHFRQIGMYLRARHQTALCPNQS